jgi:hypothetical protein
LLPAT